MSRETHSIIGNLVNCEMYTAAVLELYIMCTCSYMSVNIHVYVSVRVYMYTVKCVYKLGARVQMSVHRCVVCR